MGTHRTSEPADATAAALDLVYGGLLAELAGHIADRGLGVRGAAGSQPHASSRVADGTPLGPAGDLLFDITTGVRRHLRAVHANDRGTDAALVMRLAAALADVERTPYHRAAADALMTWARVARQLLAVPGPGDMPEPFAPGDLVCPADATTLRLVRGWSAGDPRHASIRCPHCGRIWSGAEWTPALEQGEDSRVLVTGAEAGRRANVCRSACATWRARGWIEPAAHDPRSGAPLYDLAEVLELAASCVPRRAMTASVA